MLSNPWFQNIASNLITIALVAAFAWVLHLVTRRSRLLSFFGLKKSKRLVLYLSNVRVQQFGSIGVDGQPRAYSGTAIPENEAFLVATFQRLFNFVVPGLGDHPEFLKWLLISDIRVESAASPSSEAHVDRQSTFITVGSPGYNSASARAETHFHSLARFVPDYTAFSLDQAQVTSDPRCGFVQRVVDQVSGQVAFYVAGMSSLGTTGAAYFLAERWQYLAAKYRDSAPFCIVLRMSEADPRSHEILFEKG